MMSGYGNSNTTTASRTRGYLGSVNEWGNNNLWGGARTLWAGGALAVLALLLYAVQPAPQQRGFGGPGRGPGGFGQPQSVGVATARRADVKKTLNALGTITPMATAAVKPQVGGLLLSIKFQEGQLVKKGDVLAEIDPRAIQNSLEQARATLARDSASLANSQLDLKRQQSLFEQNATSETALNQQKTLVATQTAAVRSDQAAVSQQELNLSYTKITAPIDGRVGLKQADVGNLVSANSTNIVTVTQQNPISVVFSLPEDSVREVNRQLAEGTELSVDIYDRAQTKLLKTGRLQAVDNVIDTTTGTVKLRGMFDNSDNTLFPNQFVNVKVLVDTIRDQTVIPSAAVLLGAAGKYVFVVNADNTVSMRTVTTGEADGDNIAITAGLKVGETVVTDGADRLREGSQVTIPDPKAQAAAAAGNAAVAAAGGPAAGAGGPAGAAGQGRGFGGQNNAQRELQMSVMRRMTDKELEAFRALTDRQERNAKIRAYSQDAGFMKRPERELPQGAFGRGGPGGGRDGGGGGFGGPGGGGGFGGGGRGG